MKFYTFAPFYKIPFNKIPYVSYGYRKKYIKTGSA